MLKNLNLTNGLFFSQRVLIELTTNGFTREEAYALVQKHAMYSWNNGTSFYENLLNDAKISNKLPVNKLKKLFDFNNLRNSSNNLSEEILEKPVRFFLIILIIFGSCLFLE